jgi:predicted nuclease of predicted toxin-antitoxin system
VAEAMPHASDTEVLEHAAAAGRWLLTFDRDYGELVFARTVPAPPAIVYLRQGTYLPAWPAEAVLALVERAEFVAGHLVVVNGRSIRRRALPATSER